MSTVKENRKRLIEALRSGKYKQGMGKLRSTSNKFCCLGVACDISGLADWSTMNTERYYYYDNHAGNFPPKEVVFMFGLFKQLNPQELARMNDSGYSFAKIADYIEMFNKE